MGQSRSDKPWSGILTGIITRYITLLTGTLYGTPSMVEYVRNVQWQHSFLESLSQIV